jgi:hypothetical protein
MQGFLSDLNHSIKSALDSDIAPPPVSQVNESAALLSSFNTAILGNYTSMSRSLPVMLRKLGPQQFDALLSPLANFLSNLSNTSSNSFRAFSANLSSTDWNKLSAQLGNIGGLSPLTLNLSADWDSKQLSGALSGFQVNASSAVNNLEWDLQTMKGLENDLEGILIKLRADLGTELRGGLEQDMIPSLEARLAGYSDSTTDIDSSLISNLHASGQGGVAALFSDLLNRIQTDIVSQDPVHFLSSSGSVEDQLAKVDGEISSVFFNPAQRSSFAWPASNTTQSLLDALVAELSVDMQNAKVAKANISDTLKSKVSFSVSDAEMAGIQGAIQLVVNEKQYELKQYVNRIENSLTALLPAQ